MVEYIEREEALATLMYAMCGTGFQVTAMREVRRIPAADVAPVVHGRWRLVGVFGFNDCYICSECGKIAMNDGNYCPNCGAKMDKEAPDGD